MGAISHKRKDKCSLIASSARRSRLDSWAAVGCGWHATVRNFRQIGVPPPLTTPATVIPCKKCKRRPGYPIDARRRWRGWRRTARILGGSCSGPALSRPPIRARPAQPEARAVFRWRHGALGGVVAKCKATIPSTTRTAPVIIIKCGNSIGRLTPSFSTQAPQAGGRQLRATDGRSV